MVSLRPRFHSSSDFRSVQLQSVVMSCSSIRLDRVIPAKMSLWLCVRTGADLSAPAGDTFSLPKVQMPVDRVEHRHRVTCKQAGPLHRVHHPLHGAAHEGQEHCGVVGQQHQAPPQLPAMVDDQVDSLVMSHHYYR